MPRVCQIRPRRLNRRATPSPAPSHLGREQGTNRHACFEVGIALFPPHRGRGLGTAAQQALVEYLFATTQVHRIQAQTEAGNRAEQRALEKVGFRQEGRQREPLFRDGQWRDVVLYGLLRSDS